MRKIVFLTAAATAVLLASACNGDDDYEPGGIDDADASTSSSSSTSGGGRTDASASSSSSSSSSGSSSGAVTDAGLDADAATNPIRSIAIDLEAELAANAPEAPSSFGFASSESPFETDGTSWRYTRTTSAGANQKFEFYLQLTAASAAEKVSPAVAQIHEYLGDITVADIASVKVHSRRNTVASPDFSMIVYTEKQDADNDATWYHHRLHAELSNASALDAPQGEWNEFGTGTAANGLRFWDFRNADTSAGPQPTADGYSTLAELQAGPITPAGLSARDYRAEKVKYLTFASYSTAPDFDASIDGIEIVLKNGKGVSLDLTGNSLVRQFSVSQAAVIATDPPSAGSTYGVAEKANSFTGGASWHITRAGAGDKFEFYVPFTLEAAATQPGASWADIRAYLGEVTLADLASVQFRSRRATEASADFSMLIYTTPTDDVAGNDKSWYRRKLTAASGFVTGLANPAVTWNLFSTNAGANQLNFWDFKGNDASVAGVPFSFADLRAGEVAVSGRDYRAEKVKWINVSTFTTQDVDAALDTIEIKLTSGKTAILDLNK